MAKTLISSPPFIGVSLPSSSSSLSRHGLQPLLLPHRRLTSSRVKLSFQEIPPIHSLDSSLNLNSIFSRVESLFYTLADAAVSLDSAAGGAASESANATATQKNGGWFSFISEAMEFVLKVIFLLWDYRTEDRYYFGSGLIVLFLFLFYWILWRRVSKLVIIRKEETSRISWMISLNIWNQTVFKVEDQYGAFQDCFSANASWKNCFYNSVIKYSRGFQNLQKCFIRNTCEMIL